MQKIRYTASDSLSHLLTLFFPYHLGELHEQQAGTAERSYKLMRKAQSLEIELTVVATGITNMDEFFEDRTAIAARHSVHCRLSSLHVES